MTSLRDKNRLAITCICPNCHREFHPSRRTKAKFEALKYPPCCSFDCRAEQQKIRQKGIPLPKTAFVAIYRRHRARVQALTMDQFGVLSDREIKLFNFAVAIGTKRAKDRRRHELQRVKRRMLQVPVTDEDERLRA